MSQLAAAKYLYEKVEIIRTEVSQRYNVAKNVDDLPERDSICKMDKKIVNLFSRNPALTLRQGQAKLK